MSVSLALGIDVGAADLYVCAAGPDAPSTWSVTRLQLSDPAWHVTLLGLIPPGAVVALEPTGWYYSRPVVQLLEGRATVLHVAHHTTAATRTDRVASQKTDPNDARALAVKAADYLDHGHAYGARVRDPELDDLAIGLRLALTTRQGFIRSRVAATNRLTVLARGIWPALVHHRAAYLRAVAAGATVPSALRALSAQVDADPSAAPTYAHHTTRYSLRLLVAELPPDLPDPPAHMAAAIAAAAEQIAAVQEGLAGIDDELQALIQAPRLAAVSTAWLTVPGATTLAVATLHAATWCNAGDFSADQLKAAVGCHPSRHESGKIVEGFDTKRGYRPAKAALHLWTLGLLQVASRPNPVAAYYDELKARGNRIASHGARGKLVRILAGVARSGRPYSAAPAAARAVAEPAQT